MSEEIQLNTEIPADSIPATGKPKKSKKAAASAPTTAPVAPVVDKVRDHLNGVTRPAAGTKTGRVWEIADAESNKAGAPVARSVVMAIGRAEGLNDATIATQYGHWRRYNGIVGKIESVPAAEGSAQASLDVAE